MCMFGSLLSPSFIILKDLQISCLGVQYHLLCSSSQLKHTEATYRRSYSMEKCVFWTFAPFLHCMTRAVTLRPNSSRSFSPTLSFSFTSQHKRACTPHPNSLSLSLSLTLMASCYSKQRSGQDLNTPNNRLTISIPAIWSTSIILHMYKV